MSHKRPKHSLRSIVHMLPVDNLSSDTIDSRNSSHTNIIHSSPTRYKKARRDPKVVEQINNNNSTKDFLPDLNVKEVDLDNSNEKVNYGFEPLDGSSPMRRKPHQTSRSLGLLQSSSPMVIPSEKLASVSRSIIYNISGVLKVIDQQNNISEQKPVLMKFTDNQINSRMSFNYKEIPIKDTSVEFNQNCEKVIFDRSYTSFTLILKQERSVGIVDSIHRVKTRIFIWFNLDENSDEKIRRIYKYIRLRCNKCEIEVLSTRQDVIERSKSLNIKLNKQTNEQIASSSSVEAFKKANERLTFLDKKAFTSLSFNKKMNKIPSVATALTPKTSRTITVSNNENESINGIPVRLSNNISANSFYSDKPPTVKNTLMKYAHSEVRVSTRSKSKPERTYLELDATVENHETPKLFKPSLRYKFEDGTKYTIKNQDFRCLYNNDWINDTILDFFIKYYVNESVSKNVITKDDVYIMSSFFYTKLISDPNNYYDNVKSWVQNSNLFERKFVIVPINMNFHWFGCIIANLDIFLKFLLDQKNGNDESTEENIDGKYEQHSFDDILAGAPVIEILTFDSLRGIHSRDIDPIKDFIIDYAKDKYSYTLEKSWIKMKTCLVPQQPNMSDCGVHVILTVKKFFEDPENTIKVWRMAKKKSRNSVMAVNEYFEKNKRNHMARKELRTVLWKLQGDQIELMKENNEDLNSSDGGNDDYGDEDLEIIEDMSHFNKEITSTKDQGDQPDQISHKLIIQTQTINKKDEDQNDLSSKSEEEISHDISSEPPSPQQSGQDSSAEIKENTSVHDIDLSDTPALRYRTTKTQSSSPSKLGIAGNILESSPIRNHSNKKFSSNINERVESKYFNNLKLKGRKIEFPGRNNESGSTSISNEDYADVASTSVMNEEMASSPSANNLNKSSFLIMPAESPNSANVSKRIIISDLELDDDVNLVGNSRDRDSISDERDLANKVTDDKLRENIIRELNDNGPSQYVDLSSPIKKSEMDFRSLEQIRSSSSNNALSRPISVHEKEDDKSTNF